jgi:hypothetical protein
MTGWDIGANGTVPEVEVGVGPAVASASLGFLRGGEGEVVGAEGKWREEAPVVGRRRRRRSATVKRCGVGAGSGGGGGGPMARDWSVWGRRGEWKEGGEEKASGAGNEAMRSVV